MTEGNRFNRISPEEAFRGIYVDFEGFENESPVIVGCAVEYEFGQMVVDKRFYPVTYPTGCKFRGFSDVIEDLVARCRDESRVLVGFTRHELNVIDEYTSVEAGHVYRDAHKIARKWVNRVHDGAVSERTFDQYMEFLGYEKPTYFGDGKTTHRLRSVLEGLQARGKDSYEDLTAVQKAKWTKLLQYNRVDCLGMRDLVLRAASEISADT